MPQIGETDCVPRRVPEANGSIVVGQGNLLAIRRPRHAIYCPYALRLGMLAIGEQRGPRRGIPDVDSSTGVHRDDASTIGRPGHTRDSVSSVDLGMLVV